YYDQQDLIFPARSSGNQRLFSKNDIKRLLKIKELLAAGNSIETVRSKLKPPEAKQEAEKEIDFDDSLDYYSDVDLDSLYPVSNRSELLKKLSRSKKKDSQKEEE
ncbi:MAG: MerR family transcriptional regulator, partial [Halanaerobium sp.]